MEFCHSCLFVTFVVMTVDQIVGRDRWIVLGAIDLIDSHHYKRHKKTRMTEFHSPSLSILIITQSKVSFLGDRFREHLRDVEKNDKDASKPVARHFNLPNHSKKHMAICGLSLHLGTTESRKNLEQKFIFQIGSLNPHGINERFSFN